MRRTRWPVLALLILPLAILISVLAGVMFLGDVCWRCWFTPGEPHDPSGALIDRSRAAPSLTGLAVAQVDFRANDRDGNGVMDFWRRDVAGFYVLAGPNGQAIKLIELGTAGADDRPKTTIEKYTFRGPRSGYWYRAIRHANEEGSDPNRFAFCMYPADYRHGFKLTFILDETNRMWAKDLGREGGVEFFPEKPETEGWRKID